jgi:predicted nucleic acid-binding protein
VQEFLNVALRRFSKPVSATEGVVFVDNVSPVLSAHPSQALYGEALRLGGWFRLPWYDSLIVASAIEGKCDVLYNENFHDGQRIGGMEICRARDL